MARRLLLLLSSRSALSNAIADDDEDLSFLEEPTEPGHHAHPDLSKFKSPQIQRLSTPPCSHGELCIVPSYAQLPSPIKTPNPNQKRCHLRVIGPTNYARVSEASGLAICDRFGIYDTPLFWLFVMCFRSSSSVVWNACIWRYYATPLIADINRLYYKWKKMDLSI